MSVYLPVVRLVPNSVHFSAVAVLAPTFCPFCVLQVAQYQFLQFHLTLAPSFFPFIFLQLCQHCIFIVYFPVASLVPLLRVSAASFLWWVFVNKMLLCLCCLCVTIELEKWKVNCQKNEKCRAIYKQQLSTEKYCDGDLIMSLSLLVMLVYFASKKQATFPE